MTEELPTPSILINGAIVRRNLQRMAAYTKEHRLGLRPHTKTHKSTLLGRMQMDFGAVGLTVAKVGEMKVMAEVSGDLLMAYPAVHPSRCAELATLARSRSVRVGIDSTIAADALHQAATSTGVTIGILVDLDVGHHRTGVQSPQAALELAQHVSMHRGLRVDGLMFYPGHLSVSAVGQDESLRGIDAQLSEVIGLWSRHGLAAKIVSGGSTPTAYRSHVIKSLTEIRPGTYVFNDMNCVRGGCATLEECAARIVTTVVSNTVPGQFVLDAGSKTLTSDRCGPAPDSGHGYVVEYPQAKITKLTEEHAQVDVSGCDRTPKVGDRVHVIPNHICPCVNLQDNVWWKDDGELPRRVPVEARGRVF